MFLRLLPIVAAILILGLAACGDGGAPAATAPATPTTAPRAQATAPSVDAAPRAVVLDPGHGGPEVGAAANGVVEKESNLDMALRVEKLLRIEGLHVVLTRRTDARAVNFPAGRPATGAGATRADLQARIDLANENNADLFVSFHSNGSTDARQSGVEAWYDPNRAFGSANRRLADLLQRSVLEQLATFGYSAGDRGLKDDTCFRQRFGRCFPLYLLGPGREVRREEVLRRGWVPEDVGFAPGQESIQTRPTLMPGALVELLFITNASDAAVLRDEGARQAMARGVANAIMAFLRESA